MRYDTSKGTLQGIGEELLLAPVGTAGAGDESLDYLRQLPARLPVVVT
jgi:hypothetical protein